MSIDFSFWTLFYFLSSLIFGIIILLEKKHPVKALAYLAAVFLLPVAGILLYLFFGRDYRKRKLFSRKGTVDARQISQWKAGISFLAPNVDASFIQSMVPYDKIIRLLYSNDHSVLTTNNACNLLRNGEQLFPALFADCRRAKHHIHLEFFIVEEGSIATELAGILLERAAAGVSVRFIYDDIGSRKLSDHYISRLRQGGILMCPFMPVRFVRFTDKVNYRDHRKIVIIDGKIAYTGGINISDRYDNRLKNKVFWRDTQLRIVGDAVLSFQLRFLLNWQFVSGNRYSVTPEFFPDTSGEAVLPMQVIAGGPDYDQPGIVDMYASAIALATRRIALTTPYFVPPEVIQRALIAAALSGVEVEMIVPYRSDSRMLDWANRAFFDDMIEAGVKIYYYKKGFIHSKTMVVDDFFCTIGTTNLDYRSFDIDFEINAVIYSHSFSVELMKDFCADKENSVLIDKNAWKSRTLVHRFAESVARLLGPVL
ncbi:MAG: cardiolipin synthase [Bacteroidales bacterium]|nr:cardiolipin synthase [Bacteroidales bacterium]